MQSNKWKNKLSVIETLVNMLYRLGFICLSGISPCISGKMEQKSRRCNLHSKWVAIFICYWKRLRILNGEWESIRERVSESEKVSVRDENFLDGKYPVESKQTKVIVS